MTNNSTNPDKCIGNVKDNCPHCGSSFSQAIGKHSCHFDLETNGRTKLCLTAEALIRASNQNTELKTEIEQLNIAGKGLHNGWKKARKAHLATCKNAQTEIDKLYTENVHLQESEAVWKTERDKVDQRRLEAESEVERLSKNLAETRSLLIKERLNIKEILHSTRTLAPHPEL